MRIRTLTLLKYKLSIFWLIAVVKTLFFNLQEKNNNDPTVYVILAVQAKRIIVIDGPYRCAKLLTVAPFLFPMAATSVENNIKVEGVEILS